MSPFPLKRYCCLFQAKQKKFKVASYMKAEMLSNSTTAREIPSHKSKSTRRLRRKHNWKRCNWMVGGHSSEEIKIATTLRQLQCGFGVAQGELNQQPECSSSQSYVQSNLISIDNKAFGFAPLLLQIILINMWQCLLMWIKKRRDSNMWWIIEFFFPLLTPYSDMMNPFLRSSELGSLTCTSRVEILPDNYGF